LDEFGGKNMMFMEDELISFCRQFVQIESLSGKEGKAAAFLKETMTALGFDEVWTDRYGSVIGKIQGRGNGPVLLFDGHIDTVPVSDPSRWSYDPFGGDLAEGRIYGRGTSDMKGAVSAMVFALAQFKRLDIQPEGDMYVSGTVYEEVFEGVALKEVMDAVHPDLVIIGESTGLNLNIGQRGRAEVKVTSFGKSAHSSNPEKGVNAIANMLLFLERLRLMEPIEHIQLGKGISVITDIISSPFPGASVIPDRCTVTIDRRLVVGEDEDSVLDAYRHLDSRVDVEIARQQLTCYTGTPISSRRFYPAWLMEEDHPCVEWAMKALHQMGLPSKMSSYQFCTNGSYSAGVAKVPTIGFGPSYEHMAHIEDEYIEIEQLIKAAQGYYAIAKMFAAKTRGEFIHEPV
jgi:putative selenium metabolism hydrolase